VGKENMFGGISGGLPFSNPGKLPSGMDLNISLPSEVHGHIAACGEDIKSCGLISVAQGS
jgi:hypothetical protein